MLYSQMKRSGIGLPVRGIDPGRRKCSAWGTAHYIGLGVAGFLASTLGAAAAFAATRVYWYHLPLHW
jgi:hypothetical protein